MDARNQRTLAAAAVAGLMAAMGTLAGTAHAEHEGMMMGGDGNKAHCYGVNKCKGTGDCGGKGHSCAGQNACKGQGYLDLSEKDCLRIEGGRLTPDAS
ncbi:MAG: hypothetical protein COV75_09070 [Candidatus Omnitrophica bacterium CG11_big_fil_rev_8_21_14_0_20_63_9]|nr:MAG: hypothetical protein COV75_09070 [Candidatus Omnitrophica bacterium CG11_big_fil_rev_8_21_14_0_20_63_9]